jgi:ABC-type amino acid transport substrate-binding protein
MKFLVIISLGQIFIGKSFGVIPSLDEKGHENLQLAITNIIETDFSTHFTTVNVIRASRIADRAGNFIKNLANSVGYQTAIRNFDLHEEIVGNVDGNNILILDEVESFWEFYKHVTPQKFRFSSNFLIVSLGGELKELESVFKKMWNKRISNVNVIYEKNSVVLMKSFLPFGGERCGDTTPKLMAVFRDGSFGRKSFFPKKFTNLRNCPIKVATFEENPYVHVSDVKGTKLEISGIDIDLANELSRILNFRKDFKVFSGPAAFGEVYANGSVDGALGEIYSKKAEVAFGGLYLNYNRFKMFDTSTIYFYVPQVFVMSLGKKLSNFEKLLLPFETSVWILIGMTIAAAFLVIFALKFASESLRVIFYGTGVHQPTINIVIAILGGSQPKLPSQNFSRFLLSSFLILCLVVRNAYQGALFKFLQLDKHQKSVDSIDGMVKEDFDLFMTKFDIEEYFQDASSRFKER